MSVAAPAEADLRFLAYPFERGQHDHARGVLDCPYAVEPFKGQWRRGWRSSASKTDERRGVQA